MDRFSTIVFDLDGTLVDSFPGILIAINRSLEDVGLPAVDLAWVRRSVGFGAHRLVAAAAGRAVDVEELMPRFRHHYDAVVCEHSPPFPGVDALLRSLAEDRFLAVASNKPSRWVERVVDHCGWRSLFGAIETPESAGVHKPDPEMIVRILAAVGRSAREALFVGDMPVDARTGGRAGIPVLGVATGAASAGDLLEAGCEDCLDRLSDLPQWLDLREFTVRSRVCGSL